MGDQEPQERLSLYLMTDDVDKLMASLAMRGIDAIPISEQAWGRVTRVPLPGGGKLGVYQPRHASPPPHLARGRAPRATQKASRTRKKARS